MKTTRFRAVVPSGTFAFLVLFASVPTASHAGLIDSDSFDYSGTALNGQNGGTGWTGAWFNTATTDNVLSNGGVSLQYPAPYEVPLIAPTPTGSHVRTGGTTGNANSSRLLSQTIPLNVDGTVRFVSALFRKNTANGATANDNILLEFVDSAANRRWGVGIEGATDKPWLNANGSTTPSAGPAVTVGDTYLMVAKIVSVASGSDQAFLKVFGTGYGTQVPAAEPTTWDATITQNTGAILDRIRIRIDSANAAATPGEVDEIRIGDSWFSVVSVPEPSSFTLLGLAGLFALIRRQRGR